MCHGVSVDFNSDRVWQAIEACDPRFDGWLFCGVKTTGIYCRPSCPARTPKRENVRLFASAAAAQAAGFRACKRCRPDATPGSPEWDLRADLVGRAMRLIADGLLDREGVAGLARRLGYTERHVHRQLVAVAGAGPLALARAQRAQTARILLETTALAVTDVAFAAGFQSVRQFNATIREVFALTPSELRTRARRHGRPEDSGALSLRLPYRAPLDGEGLVAFLGRRAVAGVEAVHDGAYRRSLRLPHGTGVAELRPADGYVHARYWLADLRDLGAAMQRSRALLDLDSDPLSVAEVLGAEPPLGALVRAAPGRRVPGAVDGHELALRAVLGQQVSLRGAATLAGRLAAAHGEQLVRPLGSVTHVFPSVQALADVDPATLAMPLARRRALLALVGALADERLVIDAGADREQARRRLLALPGIGPWTAEYIAMRALRDPDPFLPGDLGVRHALERLGQGSVPAAATRLAERWRPYRAYAVQHLWASLPTVKAKRARGAGAAEDAQRLAA
ncbi:MAG TPA: Ada metal-binding domain-containing protein [Solirubrobacteraceae bacterium]|jgi:AraC family transcriptional regulator of adaptative response / DNA-3-methyladenine glycosylase II|nr:Ada metal-binding domain-containing protein [Solirubrobacteraceae bacterium]